MPPRAISESPHECGGVKHALVRPCPPPPPDSQLDLRGCCVRSPPGRTDILYPPPPRFATTQALAATAMTAATSARMAPMACAMPPMAFLANAQEPYAALLQQMGQAAQAHALEAARLQAMAAQMQGASWGRQWGSPRGNPWQSAPPTLGLRSSRDRPQLDPEFGPARPRIESKSTPAPPRAHTHTGIV